MHCFFPVLVQKLTPERLRFLAAWPPCATCSFLPNICSLLPRDILSLPAPTSLPPPKTKIAAAIRAAAKTLHPFMLVCGASLAGLDEGTFTEGHELDRKWRVPKEMGGDGYRRRKRRGCWLRGGFEISCQACSSSSKAFASFKSRVSKPSVNQPEIGARRL